MYWVRTRSVEWEGSGLASGSVAVISCNFRQGMWPLSLFRQALANGDANKHWLQRYPVVKQEDACEPAVLGQANWEWHFFGLCKWYVHRKNAGKSLSLEVKEPSNLRVADPRGGRSEENATKLMTWIRAPAIPLLRTDWGGLWVCS